MGLVLPIGGLSDRLFTIIEIGSLGGASGILIGSVGDLAPVIVELTFASTVLAGRGEGLTIASSGMNGTPD